MDAYLATVKKLPGQAYSRVSELTRSAYGRIRTLPVRSTAQSLRCRLEARVNSIRRSSIRRSSRVGDESADESDWSSEEEGSTSKRPRNDGGHRKARRNRSRKGRKEKDTKSDEKHKSNKSLDDKQETMATPPPSAPVSRLAEVLSSKEGLKSAALKSTARDQANANETGAKVSDEVKKGNSDSTTIIKIKPPPPTAPKPRAKRTSSSRSSDGTEEKSREAKTKPAPSETTKTVTTSYGPVEDNIFDGLEIKPKLTSYKRTMGPQGRRLPQRYSNQVQSQRFSNQSNNSLAVVSA